MPVFCPVSTYRVRRDDVVERVAPIDHRPVLAGLDQLPDQDDVLLRVARDPERHALVSDPPGHQRQHRDLPQEAEVGVDEGPARLQRASAAPERLLADGVEDDVVRLAVLREVLLQAVDHAIRPKRAHELDVLRVAHGRDVGAELLRELHRLLCRRLRRRRRRARSGLSGRRPSSGTRGRGWHRRRPTPPLRRSRPPASALPLRSPARRRTPHARPQSRRRRGRRRRTR